MTAAFIKESEMPEGNKTSAIKEALNKTKAPTVSEKTLARNKVQRYAMLVRNTAGTVIKMADDKDVLAIAKEDDCDKCRELVLKVVPEKLLPKTEAVSRMAAANKKKSH